MNKPELFDIVEILVNLPEQKQFIGSQGAIVECHDDHKFEVEFSNEEGETTALLPLSDQQFIVVWKSATKQWIPTTEKVISLLDHLPENKQEEILNYARFLYQRA